MSYTVEPIRSTHRTSSAIQHCAYFIQSEGEAAFLDPLCATESEVYCDRVKASGATLRYIFDTSTHSATSTEEGNVEEGVGGGEDSAAIPHPAEGHCHVDLAVLANAAIIRGPVRQSFSSDEGDSQRLGGPLRGFASTDATDEQVFKLGKITITALLLQGSSPTECPASACCYMLKDEKGTPKILFSGIASLAADIVREKKRKHQHDGTVVEIPASTLVYTTHRTAGLGKGGESSSPLMIQATSPCPSTGAGPAPYGNRPPAGSPSFASPAADGASSPAFVGANSYDASNYADQEYPASPAQSKLNADAIELSDLTIGNLLNEEDVKKPPAVLVDDADATAVVPVKPHEPTEDDLKDQVEQEEKELTTKEIVFGVLGALLLAFLGLFEGFAFAICGICNPQVFRDQMEFASFLLIKLFLSGVGCSMIAQALYSLVAKDQFAKTRFYSNLSVPHRRAIPGCFVLGCGMYIAGTGPTMAPAMLGSGVGSGGYIMLGMFIGGLTFSLVEKTGIFNRSIPKAETQKDTSVDAKLGLPYAAVAIPGGVLLIVIAVVFEVLFPHEDDINRRYRHGGALSGGYRQFTEPQGSYTAGGGAGGAGSQHIPWSLNPILAGVVLGFNQIPIRVLSGDGQGGSTAIMNFIGTVTCGVLSPNQRVTRIQDTYQFFYVYVGTTLGALIGWQSFSSMGYEAPEGFSVLATLIGSAVMFFGARFAHGCTCGHGISGMSELSLGSIIAGMMIFGGGIASGLVNVFIVQQV